MYYVFNDYAYIYTAQARSASVKALDRFCPPRKGVPRSIPIGVQTCVHACVRRDGPKVWRKKFTLPFPLRNWIRSVVSELEKLRALVCALITIDGTKLRMLCCKDYETRHLAPHARLNAVASRYTRLQRESSSLLYLQQVEHGTERSGKKRGWSKRENEGGMRNEWTKARR